MSELTIDVDVTIERDGGIVEHESLQQSTSVSDRVEEALDELEADAFDATDELDGGATDDVEDSLAVDVTSWPQRTSASYTRYVDIDSESWNLGDLESNVFVDIHENGNVDVHPEGVGLFADFHRTEVNVDDDLFDCQLQTASEMVVEHCEGYGTGPDFEESSSDSLSEASSRGEDANFAESASDSASNADSTGESAHFADDSSESASNADDSSSAHFGTKSANVDVSSWNIVKEDGCAALYADDAGRAAPEVWYVELWKDEDEIHLHPPDVGYLGDFEVVEDAPVDDESLVDAASRLVAEVRTDD